MYSEDCMCLAQEEIISLYNIFTQIPPQKKINREENSIPLI